MRIQRRIPVLHAQKLILRSLDLEAFETKIMPCNGVLNICSYMVLNARKLVFGAECANSKGADPRWAICAFVIRLLESIISELASSEILIFQLVSLAEQAGLNLNKTIFVTSRPIYFLLLCTAIHEQIYPDTPIHSGK